LAETPNADEAEIITERFDGFQGWTDFTDILRFTGILRRRKDARSKEDSDGYTGQHGSRRHKFSLSIVADPIPTLQGTARQRHKSHRSASNSQEADCSLRGHVTDRTMTRRRH
jgi:hypothetical protein